MMVRATIVTGLEYVIFSEVVFLFFYNLRSRLPDKRRVTFLVVA